MNSKSIIDELKKIVEPSNVLTDVEDLYVYSFQGPLGAHAASKPDIVVRTRSQEEADKIIAFAKSEGISIVSRNEPMTLNLKPLTIMLDSTKHKDTSTLKSKIHEKKHFINVRTQPIDWLTSFKDTFSNKLLQKECNVCELSSGSACSGYCEIAPFFNFNETWSSKGRMLLTKGLMAGHLEPTKKLTDVIFSCTLCGQCYDPCTVEYKKEINRAIVSARHEVATKGLMPEVFKDLPKHISEQGSPLNMPRLIARTSWFKKLDETPKLKEGKILYWTGCMTAYRFPNMAISTINLMNKANVDFMMMGEEEGCCGNPFFTSGLWEEGKQNASRIVDKLKKTGAETLITGCAGCFYTFTKVYPEMFNVEVPLKILHTSQFLEKLIKDGDLSFTELKMKVTYQDPCDLGRHGEVYEQPRNVIKSLPGIEFIDMDLNRGHRRCCGGGGGLLVFNTNLSMAMANSVLIEEVLPLKVDALITACPTCYMNLQYTNRLKKINLQVYDITEIVDKVALAKNKS